MRVSSCLIVLTVILGAAAPAPAQWLELQDPQSGVSCGLINAENVVLAIRESDNALILVRGSDRVLVNAVVNENAEVVIDGEVIGTIEFAEDTDGQPRVFWLTTIGTLYRLEPDGQAVETETFPDQVGADCDVCLYWDTESDCDTTSDNGNDNSSDFGSQLGAALLSGLCGAATSSAATASLVVLFGLRLRRRRPSRSPHESA